MDRFSKNNENPLVMDEALTRAIPPVPEGYHLGHLLKEGRREFGGLCV